MTTELKMDGVTTVSEMSQEEAKEQWKRYCELIKTHPSDHAKTLKKAYHALSKGHKIIDIYQAFKQAGKYENDKPKLAICRAHLERCVFERRSGGAGAFWDPDKNIRFGAALPSVALPATTFTAWEPEKWPPTGWLDGRKTVVHTITPIIPPEFYPKGQLHRYFILWEVEEDGGWKTIPEPPGDPMLLKRLSKNLFTVLAAWDMTELEKAVIRGAIM